MSTEGRVRVVVGIASLGLALTFQPIALGQTVSGWQPGSSDFSSTVRTFLVHSSGDLIVGGDFLTVDGQTVNHVARFDGAIWHPIGSGVDFTIATLAEYQGNLFVGGWSSSGANTARLAH